MEDTELKERLLCVLRSNIDKVEDIYRYNFDKYLSLTIDEKVEITLRSKNTYTDKTYQTEKVIKAKWFWQKDKTEVIEKTKREYVSYIGVINFDKEDYEITKEEYDEIVELYEQNKKKRQIQQLDKLCKNN